MGSRPIAVGLMVAAAAATVLLMGPWGVNPAHAAITETDFAGFAISDVAVREGDWGSQTAYFTVRLNTPWTNKVSVQYTTRNGEAIAPDDYIATAGTLTFAPNEISKTIAVDVVDDLIEDTPGEPTTYDETFTVQLSNPRGGPPISRAVGTAWVDDNDVRQNDFPRPAFPWRPALSVGETAIDEGDKGPQMAYFPVRLSRPLPTVVTVDYATRDRDATAGEDYVAVAGTLTFQPNEISKIVGVRVKADKIDEETESCELVLSNASPEVYYDTRLGGHLDRQGIATIRDNDGEADNGSDTDPLDDVLRSLGVKPPTPPVPVLTIGSVDFVEGDHGSHLFAVSFGLSTRSSEPVTVDYATADGTATAPADYEPAAGTVTFAPGETWKPVLMVVHSNLFAQTDDEDEEVNKQFTINVSNAKGALLAQASAEMTIWDNDWPAVVVGSYAEVYEGDGGTQTALVTVKLDHPEDEPVVVQHNSFGPRIFGAEVGEDYTHIAGSVTFEPGETVKPIPVDIHSDADAENYEEIVITLAVVSGDADSRETAGITIIDYVE